jgi:hypothetical protein
MFILYSVLCETSRALYLVYALDLSVVVVVHVQVCDDIYRIWDYVLTEKCYIGSKMRPRLSAVLVVPDTLDNRGQFMLQICV